MPCEGEGLTPPGPSAILRSMGKSQASTTDAPTSTLADRLGAPMSFEDRSPRVQAAIALDNVIKKEKEAFSKYEEASKIFNSIKKELLQVQEDRKRAQQLYTNLCAQGAAPNLDAVK